MKIVKWFTRVSLFAPARIPKGEDPNTYVQDEAW